jgi:hypothetical protein
MEDIRTLLATLEFGLPDDLPPLPEWNSLVPHAPKRVLNFTQKKEMVLLLNFLSICSLIILVSCPKCFTLFSGASTFYSWG